MKRLILIIIFTIIISGCNNLSSNSQSNSYTLKKRHFVTIGIDIPAGIYCAKVLSEDNSSLILEIQNEDGSKETLIAVEEDVNEGTYINIDLKDGTKVSPNKNIKLLKTN